MRIDTCVFHNFTRPIFNGTHSYPRRDGRARVGGGGIGDATNTQVLNMGCNAVLAYQQDFDVEGDSGIVARAYGTACVIQRRDTGSTSSLVDKVTPSLGRQVRGRLYCATRNVFRNASSAPSEGEGSENGGGSRGEMWITEI